MYERVARCAGARPDPLAPDPAAGFLPLWHLDAGHSLFAGPLGYNAPHAHSVPVYLAGLYAPFRLRIAGGAWRSCRTAVIPAGRAYEFDAADEPLAVLYLEPGEAGVHALAPLVAGSEECDGALIGDRGEIAPIREIYETHDSAGWTGAAIDSLLTFAKAEKQHALDPRIARAVASLAAACEDGAAVRHMAGQAGLSPSRFQHLFTREVGVPFRRFRTWQRLRRAIGEIAAGRSFTEAAHRAGFFDQAHFARAFRQAFGAPPSPSLRRVRRAPLSPAMSGEPTPR